MVMVMVGVRRRDLETGDGNAGVGEKKRREWTLGTDKDCRG